MLKGCCTVRREHSSVTSDMTQSEIVATTRTRHSYCFLRLFVAQSGRSQVRFSHRRGVDGKVRHVQNGSEPTEALLSSRMLMLWSYHCGLRQCRVWEAVGEFVGCRCPLGCVIRFFNWSNISCLTSGLWGSWDVVFYSHAHTFTPAVGSCLSSCSSWSLCLTCVCWEEVIHRVMCASSATRALASLCSHWITAESRPRVFLASCRDPLFVYSRKVELVCSLMVLLVGKPHWVSLKITV